MNIQQQRQSTVDFDDERKAITDDPVTLNLQGRGHVLLWANCLVNLDEETQSLSLTIREDSINGNAISGTTAQWDTIISPQAIDQIHQRSLIGLYPVTTSGPKSFYFVGDNSGTLGIVTVSNAYFQAQYVIGEE